MKPIYRMLKGYIAATLLSIILIIWNCVYPNYIIPDYAIGFLCGITYACFTLGTKQLFTSNG